MAHEVLKCYQEPTLRGGTSVLPSWVITCSCLEWKEKATTEKMCRDRHAEHKKFPDKGMVGRRPRSQVQGHKLRYRT